MDKPRFIARKFIEGRWSFWHVIDTKTDESVAVYDAYNFQKPATQAKKRAEEMNTDETISPIGHYDINA